MEHILNISYIGLMTGIIGTGLGGVIALLISRGGKRFLSFTFTFSGGLMIAVSCFDLLPHAFELGGVPSVAIGMVLGVGIIVLLESVIKAKTVALNNGEKGRMLTAGILMGIGIALHNLPEGLAVGSGFEASVKLGLSLVIVMALHDIPEGLAMALPMKAGGFSSKKVLTYTILSGLPMGVGAFAGALLGSISGTMIGLCLSLAGGAMLYIVFGEILPESGDMHRGRLNALGVMLGIMAGIAITMMN